LGRVELEELLPLAQRVENELVLELLEIYQRSEVLACIRVVGRGRVDEVESEFESLLDHVGDDAFEEGAHALEAGVGIDLDQPGGKVAIDHEVQSEYLEVVHQILRADLGIDASCRIFGHRLHLGQDVLLEVVPPAVVERAQVVLEFSVGNFVAGLVPTVLGVALLDCVVGEVDFGLEVADVEVVGGGADVALLVPVGPCYSVEVCDQEVVSDIEFALVVQKGAVDVQLHDECLGFGSGRPLFGFGSGGRFFDDSIQFVHFVNDGDSSSLV
jgi:hypothetical protein